MRCAVGAENGTIDLWINLRHHADHRVITEQFQSDHPGSTGISTPLVSIDRFLENNDGRVSFVKMDVQGYELAVCQGMQHTLRQNPDLSILLEFMPSAMRELGFDPSHLIDLLAERGFEIYLVHPARQANARHVPPKQKIRAILTFCLAGARLLANAQQDKEEHGEQLENARLD